MHKLLTSIKSKILATVMLIMGIGFALYGIFSYQESEEGSLTVLQERSEIAAQRLAQSLELPLWELSESWVESTVLSEMTDKRVHSIFVYADDGQLFLGRAKQGDWKITPSSDDRPDGHIMSRHNILHHGQIIGAVCVDFTPRFMQAALKEKMIRDLASLTLLAGILTFSLLAFLNRTIVRRLQDILQASQAIAEGDYSQTLHVPYQDEVGLLAQGINEMSRHIQHREADLITSERRFRALVNNAADAFFFVDTEQGRIVDVNDIACIRLGYSRSELLSMTVVDIQKHFSVKQLKAIFERMPQGGIRTLLGEHQCKDGSIIPVEVQITLIEQNQHRYAIALARDISERLKAEEKNRLLSRALEQSGEAVVITDTEGMILHSNPAFTSITGYPAHEALHQKVSMLKSGKQNQAFYENMWDTIMLGKITNKKKSGILYSAMLTISPVRNEQQEIIHFVGIQQSLEKLEKIEAQFHQAQKMEAIGTLVGGIAHDFNNTLAAIVGNLYLAKKGAYALPDVTQKLDSIEKLSFSAAATIQQLLAFSRRGIVSMNPITISSFLKETVKLQQVSLSESITLNLDVQDSTMHVNGDINQLQQVLMNLINNAAYALQEIQQPTIHITLAHVHADRAFHQKHPELKSDDFACISVTDNGTGIKPEDMKHIFEPFFTTKEVGKGTGLGLAMVYGAIQTHAGAIDLQSSTEEPSGTSMRVYLPLLTTSDDESLAKEDKSIMEGHGETILLVDDNEDILNTTRDVLEGLNYHVLTAEDGVAAIEIYSQHHSSIRLMILDVVMPRLGGPEALLAIRKEYPHAKAIFATGYDKLSTLKAGKLHLKETIISKPFEIHTLSQLIQTLLKKPSL